MSKICGIFYANSYLSAEDRKKVSDLLKPRGPDYQGVTMKDGKTFIHTRLSIIDLDPRSNQPFIDNDILLIFNGEIYNYKQIKKELVKSHNYKFKTDSDTEVIVALYRTYGKKGFGKLNGMFAFVLHDSLRARTYFLRDPSGIKPLYQFISGNQIMASSTLQPILELMHPKINYRGVNYILAYGWTPITIYDNVREFEPGMLYSEFMQPEPVTWEIDKTKTIKDCIIEQYVNSDRPVGVLLSGGIDSGYLAYVCAKEAAKKNKKIHTYTIGFSTKDEDIINARQVAKLIKSNHHEIIISSKDYELNLKEGLSKIGMPIDLGSVSLTNAIGKEIAKTDIKVLLSGDFQDELGLGYKRYNEKQGLRTNELWEWYQKRIEKNSFKDRKEILKDDTMNVSISNCGYPDNANIMSFCDFKNELRFYHVKRIDHIISSFGIELRVPYGDYNYITYMLNESFAKKVNQRGNKLLLRDFAVVDGYPKELAFKPKIPMKSKTFNAKTHLIKIWKDFKKEKGY